MGAENSTGLSTNVDMVANALGRGDAWPRCRWRFKPKFRRTHGNWIRSQTSISDPVHKARCLVQIFGCCSTMVRIQRVKKKNND